MCERFGDFRLHGHDVFLWMRWIQLSRDLILVHYKGYGSKSIDNQDTKRRNALSIAMVDQLHKELREIDKIQKVRRVFFFSIFLRTSSFSIYCSKMSMKGERRNVNVVEEEEVSDKSRNFCVFWPMYQQLRMWRGGGMRMVRRKGIFCEKSLAQNKSEKCRDQRSTLLHVQVRAIILAAEGPAFSAGHDLKELVSGGNSLLCYSWLKWNMV